MPAPRAFVTTSWDDGHPLDLKTAELLARHGLTGTFYVPVTYTRRPLLTLEQMQDLAGMGMEIGSHTLTHPVLTKISADAVCRELEDSKKRLEDMLARPVTSFCYPKGKFNRKICKLAQSAGYKIARTTVAFRTALEFDPIRMPVSCQFALATAAVSIRHALKESNFNGLLDWCRLYRLETHPAKLSRSIFDRILKHGGLMHIWGHSWEMDDHGLWESFVDLLKQISHRPEIRYITNGEAADL